MIWFRVLIFVVIAVALIAFAGIRIKGARQVGNTHLMTAARVFLGIFLVILALFALGVFK
jgi:hypothetical protein